MRTLLALLVLVALLVLGGCSYDDDGDNTGGGYGAMGAADTAHIDA